MFGPMWLSNVRPREEEFGSLTALRTILDSAVCNQVSFAGCVDLVFTLDFQWISNDIWAIRPQFPSTVDSISYDSCGPELRTIRFRERVELADRFAHLQLCKTGRIATRKGRQPAIYPWKYSKMHVQRNMLGQFRADGGDRWMDGWIEG